MSCQVREQAAPSVIRQDVSDRLGLLEDALHHCQFGAPASCAVLPMDGMDGWMDDGWMDELMNE